MKNLKQAFILLAGRLDVESIAVFFQHNTMLLQLPKTYTKCAQVCMHMHVKVVKLIIYRFQR